MAKFTKADEIEVPQSVGPFLNIWPRGSNLRVYEPEQGRDLLYNNPRLDGSTEVDEDEDNDDEMCFTLESMENSTEEVV